MLDIAIDIGGTFTDVVCLYDQQRLFLAKVPTTPYDLVHGVQQGVARVLQLAGQPATAVERFVHSTTVATNAILEQQGAVTGVLMTAGFEDVLEIGRQKRSKMSDLFVDPETPAFLAPRRHRVGIRERLDAEGSILQPLDEQQCGAGRGRVSWCASAGVWAQSPDSRGRICQLAQCAQCAATASTARSADSSQQSGGGLQRYPQSIF